jgi:hypothetical protein
VRTSPVNEIQDLVDNALQQTERVYAMVKQLSDGHVAATDPVDRVVGANGPVGRIRERAGGVMLDLTSAASFSIGPTTVILRSLSQKTGLIPRAARICFRRPPESRLFVCSLSDTLRAGRY